MKAMYRVLSRMLFRMLFRMPFRMLLRMLLRMLFRMLEAVEVRLCFVRGAALCAAQYSGCCRRMDSIY